MTRGAELTADPDVPSDETMGEAPSRGRLADLYAQHIPAALRLGYLLTGDREDAEDLAQEAFVRCVGRFRYLRVPDTFDAYLRRAIVNLHTSGLRHRRVERSYLQREGARTVATTSSLPNVDEREDLWRALGSLPPRQRAALVLRFYEDLSERDAASVMGCTVPALKMLVSRGSDTLRGVAALTDKSEDA
jgi:RNA polymerase sigma-70 factor (sigma-E family)